MTARDKELLVCEQVMDVRVAVPLAAVNGISRVAPSTVSWRSIVTWAVDAVVPTGPYATAGGLISLRTSLASVTPNKPSDVPRSTALFPLVNCSSASVVRSCNMLTLAEREAFERVPLAQVELLITTRSQSRAWAVVD